MIVYNITAKIDPGLTQAWLDWQQRVQIPEMMATGLFDSHELFRLLDQDDSDGDTYISQFRTQRMDQYESFCRDHRSRFNRLLSEQWGTRVLCFQTALRLVQ